MDSLRTIWLRTLHWRRTAVESCERAAVLEHVASESALVPRYAFMTVLSSGIATLGLLQNSVAVRWNATSVTVTGHAPDWNKAIASKRAQAVAKLLEQRGISVGLINAETTSTRKASQAASSDRVDIEVSSQY